MLSPLLLPVILAIVNATIPVGTGTVSLPLSVTPVGAPTPAVAAPTQAPAAAPAVAGLDFTALGGIITTITAGLGALGFKLVKDGKRDDQRANVIADTQFKQVQSLQETDKADYIFKGALADYLTTPNEQNKLRLINLAKDSKANYDAYYEDIKPTPLDYDKDEVVKKLSAVQKRTAPN